MIQECSFCKERDLGEVVPGLSVDLFAAIESGVILDTGIVEEYNDIDSPDAVATRVRDVFHAMDLRKSYEEFGRITNTSSQAGSNESTVSVQSSGVATAGE